MTLCCVPSTSVVIQHLTQLASTLQWTCLIRLFLINKLAGSRPNGFLIWVSFFLSKFKTTRPPILTLVLSIFTSCSFFIGQVSLPCIWQLLTQLACYLPFNSTENPLPVNADKYSCNFSMQFCQSESHLHPACHLGNETGLIFLAMCHIQDLDCLCSPHQCLMLSDPALWWRQVRLSCTTSTLSHCWGFQGL